MKKTVKIFLTFLIPVLFVILFYALVSNNLFILIGIGIKQGLIVGLIFSLLDYFFLKKINKSKIWYAKVAVFLLVFVLTVVIDFAISFQGVIKPVKSILNSKFPHSAQYN